MPKVSATGVTGLSYNEATGRYRVNLRFDRTLADGTVVRERFQEKLPEGTTAKVAKAHALKALNLATSGKLLSKKAEKAAAPRTLADVFEHYLAQWVAVHRPGQFRVRTGYAKHLVAILGKLRMDDLNAFAVQRYQKARAAMHVKGQAPEEGEEGQFVSNATINREVAVLKHLCGMASEEWKWMGLDRAAAVRKVRMLKEAPGRVRHFSTAEESKLLAALPTGMKRIMESADLSGMRRSEVCLLLKSSVDLPNRQITLTRTKSNRVRHIPVNDRLAVLLTEAMQERPKPRKGQPEGEELPTSPYVFLSAHGKPYSPDSVSRAFKRATVKAKVENARFHDTRHTAATRLRRNGVGIDVIKDVLGHADITTTGRYAHVEQPLLREAMATLDGSKPDGSPMASASMPANEKAKVSNG